MRLEAINKFQHFNRDKARNLSFACEAKVQQRQRRRRRDRKTHKSEVNEIVRVVLTTNLHKEVKANS